MSVRAFGDTNAMTVHSAEVSAPWLQARLSANTRVLFTPPFLVRPASLELAGSLSEQPWIPLAGELTGRVLLLPNEARFPRVQFAVAGTNVALSNIETRTIELGGTFDWPTLTVEAARLEWPDGSKAELSGALNVAAKSVEGTFDYSGTFGGQTLPRGVAFESASIHSQFAGPISGINHSAKLQVEGLQLPRVNPLDLRAEWRGRGAAMEEGTVTAHAGGSVLRMRGSASQTGAAHEISVSELTLARNGVEEMRLEEPFVFTIRAPGENARLKWHRSVAGARPDRRICTQPHQLPVP
jgi:hypothetical protein